MQNLHIELPFFVILLLCLALARVLGEFMERLGQPSMIGEILAGVLLGPSVFGLIHMNAELKVFAEMGVFLLIIIAGMEIKIADVLKGLRGKNIWISLLGFFLPLLLGLLVGQAFGLSIIQTIFVALCISITALPVSVRILMDLGKLNSSVGQKIITVAIFNDVAALTLLGILLDVLKKNAASSSLSFIDIVESTGITLLKVLLFIVLIFISFRLANRLSKKENYVRDKLEKLVNRLKSKESFFAIIFVFILLFASFSEAIGLHFIVGAFFGSMLLSHELLGKENFENVERTTSNLAMGFLAPVFFATLGLEVNIGSITNWWMLLGILGIAFISKIVGGYGGSRLAGLTHYQSLAIGFGLNGRGIVELVIANIALNAGFITESVYTILIIMGLVTTLSTPFLMRWVFKKTS